MRDSGGDWREEVKRIEKRIKVGIRAGSMEWRVRFIRKVRVRGEEVDVVVYVWEEEKENMTCKE